MAIKNRKSARDNAAQLRLDAPEQKTAPVKEKPAKAPKKTKAKTPRERSMNCAVCKSEPGAKHQPWCRDGRYVGRGEAYWCHADRKKLEVSLGIAPKLAERTFTIGQIKAEIKAATAVGDQEAVEFFTKHLNTMQTKHHIYGGGSLCDKKWALYDRILGIETEPGEGLGHRFIKGTDGKRQPSVYFDPYWKADAKEITLSCQGQSRTLTLDELKTELANAKAARDFQLYDFMCDLQCAATEPEGEGFCEWAEDDDALERFLEVDDYRATTSQWKFNPHKGTVEQPKGVTLTCKRCGNTETMDPKYAELIKLGVCSVDCANLLHQRSVKKKVKPSLRVPPDVREAMLDEANRMYQRKQTACTRCGDPVKKAGVCKQCAAILDLEAEKSKLKPEPGENEKECPNCKVIGDIDELFGWRMVPRKNGMKRVPQSRCHKCR